MTAIECKLLVTLKEREVLGDGIVPTSHLALNLYPHLLEFPVKMGMQLPLLHLLMQFLHRFPTDGGEKAREALTLLSIP